MNKIPMFLAPFFAARRLILCLILAAITAPAQQSSPTDFAIGSADLLDINVLGVPDFTRELRVSGTGTIRLPFLGDVAISGLTCREAEAKLTKLLNPDYVPDPQVSISIKESRSRMFSLMGAVARPGQFQILESVTLVSAIAGAGGLDILKAGDKATIQRSNGQIEVDLKKLLMHGEMSLDVPIKPGDVISIPQREVSAVYVIGDVGKPGPFDSPADKGIKLSRAIAMAGGPTKTAKLKNTTLIRQKPDGSMERIALDAGKVLSGKSPDLDLQPNDLLFIPSSISKNIGWATLATIPSSILSRLIIY
jgi:polysaccharide biosynthesis/export protein